MNKLIIDNRTDLSDLDILIMIGKVIGSGRISNNDKQYCYGTAFKVDKEEYMVYTDLNKKSDRFIIIKNKKAA